MRNSWCAVSGGSGLRFADDDQAGGDPGCGFDPREFEREGVAQRPAVEERRPQSEHRALRLAQRRAGGGSRLSQRGARIQRLGDGALGGVDLEHDRGEPPTDGVVHVADDPFAFRHHRGLAFALIGQRVQSRVRDRDRRVRREQLDQRGIRLGEPAPGIAAEHDAAADDRARPADGHADHAVERPAVAFGDVTAAYVRVLVEDHGPARLHDRTRHALVEWEGLPREASDAEVDLLAVRSRCFVDRADRAAVALEELHRVPQDPFEQWFERELSGEVGGQRGERLEPRDVVVGRRIRRFRMEPCATIPIDGRRGDSPSSHHAPEPPTAPPADLDMRWIVPSMGREPPRLPCPSARSARSSASVHRNQRSSRIPHGCQTVLPLGFEPRPGRGALRPGA